VESVNTKKEYIMKKLLLSLAVVISTTAVVQAFYGYGARPVARAEDRAVIANDRADLAEDRYYDRGIVGRPVYGGQVVRAEDRAAIANDRADLAEDRYYDRGIVGRPVERAAVVGRPGVYGAPVVRAEDRAAVRYYR